MRRPRVAGDGGVAGPLAFHPSTLRRAVLNVVQNAIEAMPNGGMLRLECVATTTAVQLRVVFQTWT